MGVPGAVLLALAVAAGLAYDRLSGRNLLRDTLTRLRLASRSLAAWDARWQAREDKTQAVICMTTTPSRLPRLGPTLKSLLAQDAPVRRIRLHLPAFSKREQRSYEVPAWLSALAAVEIVRCDDWGPATKLIPALGAFGPSQPLIVVDDDMIYVPTMVADLLAHAQRHPQAAIACAGWVVPDDLTDRATTWKSHLLKLPPAPVLCTLVRKPWPVDIMQGYAGYLVRPEYFDLAAVTDYSGAPPAAFFVDDVWLSAHCAAPRQVHPCRRFCFDRLAGYFEFKRNSLGLLNRGCGDPAQRSNSIMIRHFAARWLHHRGPDAGAAARPSPP